MIAGGYGQLEVNAELFVRHLLVGPERGSLGGAVQMFNLPVNGLFGLGSLAFPLILRS